MVKVEASLAATDAMEQLTDEIVKEVYARYGLAAYRAQCLELELVFLLLLREGLDNGKLTPRQFDNLDGALSKKTMGGLFKALRGRFKLDANFGANLESCLEKRNYLIHRFFPVNSRKMLTAAGCRQLLEELNELTSAFEQMDSLRNETIEERPHPAGDAGGAARRICRS